MTDWKTQRLNHQTSDSFADLKALARKSSLATWVTLKGKKFRTKKKRERECLDGLCKPLSFHNTADFLCPDTDQASHHATLVVQRQQ